MTSAAAVLIGLLALALSSVMPIVIRPLLVRIGVVDVPNERSSHTAPTIRGGGLAALIAWDTALFLALILEISDPAPLLIVLVAVNLAAVIGFVDDVLNLRAGLRLVAQLLIGAGVSLVVCELVGVSPWWSVAGTLAVAAYINVANFIDGINGISGAHGIVAGLAFFVAGLAEEQNWLVLVGAVLAGAFAGFLPWNLRRPSLFLGDVGSYMLGAAISVTIVLAVAFGVSPLLVIPPVALWIADAGATIIRRFVRAEGVLSAHRTHAYQRLTDTGMLHGSVALLGGLLSAITSLVGFLAWRGFISAWLGWLIVAIVCTGYLVLPRLRGSKLPPAPAATLVEGVEPVSAKSPSRTLRRWAVVGASGFVGAGVSAHLRENGIDVIEVSAPRLNFDPHELDGRKLASAAESEPAADQLARLLSTVDVVVNAAGVAAPDGEATRALTGANAYLPSVLAVASRRAGVVRLVHLSSAAVQGRVSVLDETSRVAPFSPYSRSKALGERALAAVAREHGEDELGVVVLRATSVQGAGRPTTLNLQRLALSPLASVAAPGTQSSAVSSLHALCTVVALVGRHPGRVPGIVLQPWEGYSVTDVLEVAGHGKTPRVLPRWLCIGIVACGYAAGRIAPQFAGLARRLEMLWVGQSQVNGWATGRIQPNDWLAPALSAKVTSDADD